jgi:CRP-like cAMP-binding protein
MEMREMQDSSHHITGVRPVEAGAGAVAAAKGVVKESGGVPLGGLLTNRLLSALPAEDFARLLPHLEPVSLSADEELYKLGEPISFAYFLENAVVSQLHLLADGNTTETAIIGYEGMIGLSAILSSHLPLYLTQVLLAGSALRIRTDVLKQEFNRGRALQQLMLSYASARLTQISQKAVCNGRHKLEERLCCWLLMIQDRLGNGELRLTQEQIAHHLGARRAGVTCVAAALRDKDIISYRRGVIRILDRSALEAAACECYRTFNSLLQ